MKTMFSTTAMKKITASICIASITSIFIMLMADPLHTELKMFVIESFTILHSVPITKFIRTDGIEISITLKMSREMTCFANVKYNGVLSPQCCKADRSHARSMSLNTSRDTLCGWVQGSSGIARHLKEERWPYRLFGLGHARLQIKGPEGRPSDRSS